MTITVHGPEAMRPSPHPVGRTARTAGILVAGGSRPSAVAALPSAGAVR